MSSEHHPTLPPSSFPMFAKCPCYKSGETGEAAESGSRQHALLAMMLDDHQVIPEDKCGCSETEVEQVEWARGYIACRTTDKRLVEKRLTLMDDDFNEITFGTLDVVELVSEANGDVLKIFDYKSGEDHGYQAQMAVYARMAMIAFGQNRCEVHEVYGRRRHYDEYRITLADTDFIMDIIKNVQNPDKVPALCSFCNWCAQNGTCPAATTPIVKVATEYEPENPVAALPLGDVTNWHASQITDPKQMSIVLMVAEHLGKWAAAVKAHAQAAALQGMEIPGYALKPGRRTRTVTDMNLVYEASGLTLPDFLGCCSASVPELEKEVARKNGHKSAGIKAAKDDFKSMLGNFIVYREGAPTLSAV